MSSAGVALIVVGLLLFAASATGAATEHRSDATFSALKWLWGQLQAPIDNLTESGLKWYRRTVALGQICLLVGLFLVVVDVVQGDNPSGNDSAATTPATATT